MTFTDDTLTGKTFLGLNVDNETLIINDQGVLKGNYVGSGPIAINNSTVTLNYDS